MATEWDGKVAGPIFACTVTGRAFLPGESFFSGLVLEAGVFRRRDFSPEAWTSQTPSSFLSWWRQRVPEPANERKTVRLDADLLQKLFTDLRGSRERPQQCLCYVIVLCLVRARVCVLAGIDEDPDGTAWLLVDHKPEGLRLRVRDPRLGTEELAQVQQALLGIVGAA